MVRDFERYVNQKYAKQLGKRPITVYHQAHDARQAAARASRRGSRDIAVGNLTVTEERLKLVDFVAPGGACNRSRSWCVTGPKSPPIAAVDDLSGKTVHVRQSSSYYESLLALNDRFKQAGKPPVKIWSSSRMRSRTRT